MSEMSENLWPFKAVFSFGNNQKSDGDKSGEYGGWSKFHYRFFGQKLPDSERVMSKGIAMMQDSGMRPQFRSSPTKCLM
jgi:hypothetical protein